MRPTAALPQEVRRTPQLPRPATDGRPGKGWLRLSHSANTAPDAAVTLDSTGTTAIVASSSGQVPALTHFRKFLHYHQFSAYIIYIL